ncbi:MAG: TonB-dependent receptor domain-containing protein, partial [Terriglobia bacterium]
MTARLVPLIFLASLFVPLCLSSQTVSGNITGTVLDPNGDPVPRAAVRLLAGDGAEVARTRTDSRGRFRFEHLPDAKYTLRVELVGFEPATRNVTPGSEVEVTLELAPVREQVVVTATRTEAPSAQVGASTSVITQEELANRLALPVNDLLRPVAGTAVARAGGLGNTTSVFVRGGESDYNKVLLDGIVLNEPGGTFFFSNLMTENLERVEVVRGPQSALFGSDAMASVIQLFTRRGRAETLRPRLAFTAEGGSNDTWRTRAQVSGQAGLLDYSLHWARLSTDNREPNNTFHNTSLSGNFGLELNDRTTLRVIARGELGRLGTPGPTAFGRPDRDALFRERDADLGITLRNQTASFWEQRLTYSFAKSRQVSRNLVADPPFVPEFEGRRGLFPLFDFPFDFLNDNRRHHLSYQSDWQAGGAGSPAGQHVFTFAFEWDRELGAFGDRLFGQALVQAQRDNFGTVVQHQAIWGRLFLTNGFRVEDNDSFGTSVVPRTSLAYLLRQGSGWLGTTKLKFNFGLGIKEPTLVESFSPSPFFQGNPALGPERIRSFDFGAEQRFGHDRGKLEVNWFDNRFRDLIAFTFDFVTFTGTFENIGRSKAKGAEVILELAPGAGLRGVGTYTFLDSQVTEST